MSMEVCAPTIGLACQDIDLLQARCLVAGVQILEAAQAASLGYIDSDVIVPTEFRIPTEEELDKLIATPDTDITMQLCRLPFYIGGCILNDVATIGDEATRAKRYSLAPGVDAQYVEQSMRYELAPTSSVDRSKPGSPKVGLHIDNYPPDTLKHIISLGPSRPGHLISPDITRAQIGGRTPAERLAYVRQLDPGSAIIYAILFGLPQPNAFFTDGMEPIP
jgi:hypothetical protein